MGKTYKDRGGSWPPRQAKTKRHKAKGVLKDLPAKFKEEKDPYNSLEVDYYDEGNFEKFKKRR